MNYKNFKLLKQDWFTTEELYIVLKRNGFASNLKALMRWEQKGVIPKPTTVRCAEKNWRVYNKDGSDFKIIIDSLNRYVVKVKRIYFHEDQK
jgi:hypothetical protein